MREGSEQRQWGLPVGDSALPVTAWPSAVSVLPFLPHPADTAYICLVEVKCKKQDFSGMAPRHASAPAQALALSESSLKHLCQGTSDTPVTALWDRSGLGVQEPKHCSEGRVSTTCFGILTGRISIDSLSDMVSCKQSTRSLAQQYCTPRPEVQPFSHSGFWYFKSL